MFAIIAFLVLAFLLSVFLIGAVARDPLGGRPGRRGHI